MYGKKGEETKPGYVRETFVAADELREAVLGNVPDGRHRGVRRSVPFEQEGGAVHLAAVEPVQLGKLRQL